MKTLISVTQFLVLILLPGILQGQNEQIRLYLPSDSDLPYDNIMALTCDKDNILWIGGVLGVTSFNGSEFKNYNKNHTEFFKGLMYSTTSLNTDNKGILWIGSTMGIIKFDGNQWTSINKDNSELPGNNIRTIFIDKENTVWIGGGKGLVKFKDNTWKIYDKKTAEFPSNTVNDIKQDLDGTLWIGSNKEIIHFNPADETSKVHNKKTDGLPGDSGGALWVSAIEIDSNGTKWFGTSLGLIKYDGNIWKVYKEDNTPLPSSNITALAIDKKGNIWVGCGGLYNYYGKVENEKQIYATYVHMSSVKPLINPEGSLITSTSSTTVSVIKGGVAKFNGTDWKIFTPSKGLPDYYPELINDKLIISCIISDRNGNIWVGTSYNGMARISNIQ